MGVHEVEHAPGPATTGAALGVAGDGALLIEETQCLLQHRFREAQLGMGAAQIVHQRRWIGIGLQQALQHPTHRQLKAEMLNGGTLKKGTNGAQTRARLQISRTH
jgi:hypothetical protein